MKGIRKLGVAAVALAVGMSSASYSRADHGSSPDDPYTSFTQPANALVMPFDATSAKQSFFVVSNLAGISPTGDPDLFIPAVTTHWAYWSDTCKHLADVWVCLTLNDTVVIDPTDIQSVDAGNNPYGPKIDLSGQKGVAVVTSYSTGEVCADGSFEGFLPIDDAIVGSYTFADKDSGAAFGGDAIGLGLNYFDGGLVNANCPIDPFERFIKHLSDPDFDCHTELPKIQIGSIDIQTFNPETLDLSVVALLSLQEKSGNGLTQLLEVGPNSKTITVSAAFWDNTEAVTSLPEITIKCVTFGSLMPADDSFIPDTISGLTAGILRLGGLGSSIGAKTEKWIYAVYGQSVGQFGAGANGKYKPSAQ